MSKRTVYTKITPLPSSITRQTVLETLRDHILMIELNPLVTDRHPCRPPSFASPEEYHATWYSITDRISYLPGIRGSIQYHACFHDLPTGLQTHCFAAMGVNIRGKWTVGGNLPGEPREPVELGVGMPKEGLYLREDVDVKCNVLVAGVVKKNLLVAHKKLVERMVEKAHLRETEVYNQRLSLGPGEQGMVPPPTYKDMMMQQLEESPTAAVGGGRPESYRPDGYQDGYRPDNYQERYQDGYRPDSYQSSGSLHSESLQQGGSLQGGSLQSGSRQSGGLQQGGSLQNSPRVSQQMLEVGHPMLSPMYHQVDPAYLKANNGRWSVDVKGQIPGQQIPGQQIPGQQIPGQRPGSQELPARQPARTPSGGAHPPSHPQRHPQEGKSPVEMEG